MHHEHILDDTKIRENGFIGRATARAYLRGFLTAKLKNIYPVAVIEFLGFLDTKKLTTKVSCVDPQMKKTCMATVDVRKLLTKKLGLHDFGKKVEEAGHWHYLAEFCRFSNDNRVCFLTKIRKDGKEKTKTSKLTSFLKTPYKDLCDLVTKTMMCHTGNISIVTWLKLRALSTFADEVVKIE